MARCEPFRGRKELTMAEKRTEPDESMTDATVKPSPPVVGFFYQKNITAFVFSPIPSHFPPGASTGHLRQTHLKPYRSEIQGNTVGLINSSNGLILLYWTKPTPRYLVHNPITHDKFHVRLAFNFRSVSLRFLVFGFAFDPYRDDPCFTIVQVSDIVGPMPIRVCSYTCSSSLRSRRSASWVTTHHALPKFVRDKYFALSGPSVFYRGALHWLLEPSGVVAYNISTKSVSFSLVTIPGDEKYVDGDGVCSCVKKMKNAGLYSNGCCSCRYLGESGDKLVYVRVTDNSRLTMWTLTDYFDGVWLPTGDIVVDKLPRSLYLGRMLAFDRTEPRLLYLVVGSDIFSYSCISGELKELCKVVKEYGGRENCLGFIIPYELQNITPSIPKVKSKKKRNSASDILASFSLALTPGPFGTVPKFKERLERRAEHVKRSWNDDNLFHLYEQSCISQVAGRYFPPPTYLDVTRPPIWSFYNFNAPFSIRGLRDTVYRYNDIMLLQACLYGCTAERELKCISVGSLKCFLEAPILQRYQARDVSLLGFFHQRSHSSFVFTAIPSNLSHDVSAGRVSQAGMQSHGVVDDTLAVLNSSSGLLLLYSSKPTPHYEVYNPTVGERVSVGSSYFLENVAERFMVFGFSFNPYCTNPYFTIVEVTDHAPSNSLRVDAYSSLSPSVWETTFHQLPSNVRDDYVLLGQSIFYEGALHWLLEPSGVIAYNIHAKTISVSLMNIPVDEDYLDENGLCCCIKKMRGSGMYSSGRCSCRYLGESGDQLVYTRVTGDSELSLWILKDYDRGEWSTPRRIAVEKLSTSLSFGCLLAFDRMDPGLLFIRVKKQIFSYNCVNEELKLLCEISKDYGGQENCLGFIIPYELPRIPATIPNGMMPEYDRCLGYVLYSLKCVHEDSSDDMVADPRVNTFLAKVKAGGYGSSTDGVLHLYHLSGISQVAVNYFPHQKLPVEFDATGPPLWSSYNFDSPSTLNDIRDAVVKYNDFVRLEASLYGCIAERKSLIQVDS
ncbi:hypothetical protein RHSIM_Rhsim11G0048400 [Rhododendron simsii]|uniref:Uncharacterized protein n=1 Tax=Rhododendron simsii TaxID=118357 RepID=A0A834LAP1_RHOSS|nr:hypothetical protein RHSIM_Rhsim11G0048400 [Rhododendron simsii]